MATKKKRTKQKETQTNEEAQLAATKFLALIFRDLGVRDFLTFDAEIEALGAFTITFQRQSGITPPQLLARVHEENRELRKQLSALEELLQKKGG